jgi:hypothetical protein
MSEFEITCVHHADSNEPGLITHVGINGKLYTIMDIVNAMTNYDTFHTFQDNRLARVQRRQHHTTRRWYLTTNPDDTRENNLDYLPVCPNDYRLYNQ